ncbi:hypothetical protein VMCG_05648 [Cytospora schulzeri]|uniref:Uncharacterized protein n=1 Tax=Cytospora schulzeri TaxID=448051 RepID=A0A423WF10_9PEZI|nr:hypothetical protein VMCG_05648 [Valsa malicola]
MDVNFEHVDAPEVLREYLTVSQMEVRALVNQRNALLREVKTQAARIKMLEETNAEMKGRYESAEAARDRTETAKVSLQEQIASLQDGNASLQDENASLKEKTMSLLDSRNALGRELQEEQSLRWKGDRARESLERDLTEKDLELSDALDENEKLRIDIRLTTYAKEQVEKSMDSMKTASAAIEGENEKLRAELRNRSAARQS